MAPRACCSRTQSAEPFCESGVEQTFFFCNREPVLFSSRQVTCAAALGLSPAAGAAVVAGASAAAGAVCAAAGAVVGWATVAGAAGGSPASAAPASRAEATIRAAERSVYRDMAVSPGRGSAWPTADGVIMLSIPW